MAEPEPKHIRYTIINENNEDFMPDDIVDMYIKDAVQQTGQTDELSLRYYTCWLIAQSWGNIKDVSSVEGTTYTRPSPEKFKELYANRVRQLNNASGTSKNFRKVSVNRTHRYDETSKLIRVRRSGDTP